MENVKQLLTNTDSNPLNQTYARQLIGTLVAVDSNNQPLVDYDDNPANTPIRATSLILLPINQKASLEFPLKVLITLIDEKSPPIIVGIVHEQPFSHVIEQDTTRMGTENNCHEISADFIHVQGNEEIQFNCGKSSLSLKKDGQVIIKGENITNRARGNNKIKGASVKIN